jgi:hypothetical protein
MIMSTKITEKPATQRLAMALLCAAMLLPAALPEARSAGAGKRQALKLLSETAAEQTKRLALAAPVQSLH